jgi:flagellar biosynthesis GTPase FlhF
VSAAPELLQALEREAARLGVDTPSAPANGAGPAGAASEEAADAVAAPPQEAAAPPHDATAVPQGALRTYRGRSLEQVIPQIQEELGSDAVIVRRREGLAGGVFGFFQHAFVEVEAMPGTPRLDVYDAPEAAEPPPVAQGAGQLDAGAGPGYGPPARMQPVAPVETSPAAPAQLAGTQAPPAELPVAAPSWLPSGVEPGSEGSTEPRLYARTGAPAPAPWAEPLARAAHGGTGRDSAPAHVPVAVPATEPYDGAYVTAQLAALARNRGIVPQLAGPPTTAPRPPATPREPVPAGPASHTPPAVSPQPHLDPPYALPRPAALPPSREAVQVTAAESDEAIERALRRRGMSEELAWELLDAAEAHALALAPQDGLARAVRATLAARIPMAEPLPAAGALVVLVGAAGSGKTSAGAALLAAYRASSTLRASFATLLRGGDGDLQMILSPHQREPVPAASPRALRTIDAARERGMVIFDTPGLAPGDTASVRELARLLGQLEPDRVLVALPATLGAVAAERLLAGLAPVRPDGLVLTQVDATAQLGTAVEAACTHGIAPEYTLGRARRGYDLCRLAPHELAERILP